MLGNSSIGDRNTSVVAISITANNDVYVATSSNQVLVKTNNANSWSSVASTTPTAITALTTNQNNVYITIAQATNNVLQLNTDNNAWNIIGSGSLDGYSPTTILVTNNNTYIGTYGGDVYQLSSTNTWSKIGATFVDLSQNAVPVSSLTNYKNHVYASTFAGNNYFITTENSTSWTPTGIGTLDETQILTTIVDASENIYAGTAVGNLWVKSKNDTTWTNLSEQNPTTLFGITELAINNNNLIYVLDGDGNLWTTSINESWQQITESNFGNSSIETMTSNINGDIIVATNDGNIYQLTHNQNSWTLLTSTPLSSSLNHIIQIVSNTKTIYVLLNDNTIYQFDAITQQWNKLAITSPDSYNITNIATNSNSNLYIVTYDGYSGNPFLSYGNVWQFNNNNWIKLGGGIESLDNSTINTIVTDNMNNVYVGNSAGNIWMINSNTNKWVNTFMGNGFDVASITLY